MTIERALETQRLRLLRLVAGWLMAVEFICPFAHVLPRWASEGLWSILSRAELAGQYLVIIQARVIAAKAGSTLDPARLLDRPTCEDAGCEIECSLSSLRDRLEGLLALIEDLPRLGLRLLRRTEKRVRRLLRAARSGDAAPNPDGFEIEALHALRLVGVRIERPPDKGFGRSQFSLNSPRRRAGGEGGWGSGFSLSRYGPGPAKQHEVCCIASGEAVMPSQAVALPEFNKSLRKFN